MTALFVLTTTIAALCGLGGAFRGLCWLGER